MPGPTNVNISSNMSLYDAFKTLTTERSHNKGTIEIVKEGASEVLRGREAKITGLQCANHHFTRTSLNDANGRTHTTPQDLRATLQTAIEAELAGALSKLKSSNITRFDDGQAEIKANFQKLKDACLSPLYEGKNLKNSEFTRVEIGQIITNVEKIKQNLNIEQLLNANTISSDDMGTLKDVARFALGSGRGEGSLGGRGFMGITEDGKIVKFLTHRGESMDGISQEGKQLATAASDRLRDKLAGIAEKLSRQQQGKVMDILNRGRGSEPLSRQDVARVLTLIGGSALDTKGNLFNWGDIQHAGTVKDTTLGAVFGVKSAAEVAKIKTAIKFNDNLKMPTKEELKNIDEDYRKLEMNPYGAKKEKIAKALVNNLKRLEFDSEAKKNARDGYEKINLQTLNDIKIEDVQDTTKTTSKEKFEDFFEIIGGGTASVAQEIVQKNGKDNVKLSAQIFADNTDFLCGIDGGWNTQEEALAYASNDEAFKSIIAAGKVKLCYKEVQVDQKVTHQWRWEYNSEVESGSLDAVDSYAFKGQLNRDGKTLNPLEEPINLDWQFGAMPSFSLKESRDPRGNLAYLCKCRGLPNSPLTPQLRNAQKFIETLIAKQGSLEDEQKKEALKLLMFSGENDKFNVFGDNPEKEADKLIKLVQSGGHKVGGENSLLDQAQKNYKSTLLKVVSGWVALARERGTTHFIGGAAGLGAFKGDLDVVADVFAEAFAKHGGGMKFVYAAYHGPTENNAQKFLERFKAKFNEVRGQEGSSAGVGAQSANEVHATEPKKETAPANSAAPAESVGRSTANVGAQPVLDFHKDMRLKHNDLANMASRAIKDIAQGNGTLDEKSEKMEKYLTKLYMDLFSAGGGAQASKINGLLNDNKTQIKTLARQLAERKEKAAWQNAITALQTHLSAVAVQWGEIVDLSLESLHENQEQLKHDRGFSMGYFLFERELVEALKA